MNNQKGYGKNTSFCKTTLHNQASWNTKGEKRHQMAGCKKNGWNLQRILINHTISFKASSLEDHYAIHGKTKQDCI